MKKRGFTLIEILVAMAAGTLILMALYSIYVVNSKSYRKSVNQQELAQNGRIAMERMTRDIRQTYEVIDTLPLIDTDPLNPPPSHIQFQDGHETAQIQYIKYYLDGTNLRRQVFHYTLAGNWVAWDTVGAVKSAPTKDEIKADKIASLKFFGSTMINIDLQVANSEDTFSFKTKTWGRNI